MAEVAFGNLCKKDQEVIRRFEGKGGVKKPAANPDAFKELPLADRKLIPERLSKDLGGGGSSYIDPLWVSLLWWNAFEVVPIPKSGDFDRKAEWLLKELNRYMRDGGDALENLQ